MSELRDEGGALDPAFLIHPREPATATGPPSVVEARAHPRECAAWVVSVDPGPETAAVLGQLDPTVLSQPGRVDALVGLERLAAWVAARQARVLAAMAADRFDGAIAPGLDREWVKEDVRAALGESDRGAAGRLHEATALVERLPLTLTALEQGRIAARHARAVGDSVATLDHEAARMVEAAVLPTDDTSGAMPVMAALRRRLRRAVDRADPRSAQEKAARAVEDRDVWVMPQDDGMAFVGAPLPAEGAETVYAAVTAKAERDTSPADARTAAQRRADALVGLCADYLAGASTPGGVKIENDTGVPRWRGLRPAVNICVALSTLLGLDEEPGQLANYGPVPASVARLIAADPTGTWRRLLTDERGRLIDYGRSTYRPPQPLAHHVAARDRNCRFPGCHRRAEQADLHHIRPWSQGGTTAEHNLLVLCRRHHHAVHDAGWRVHLQPDGAAEWTSPTGHTYTRENDPYPVDHTNQREDRNGRADAA